MLYPLGFVIIFQEKLSMISLIRKKQEQTVYQPYLRIMTSAIIALAVYREVILRPSTLFDHQLKITTNQKTLKATD